MSPPSSRGPTQETIFALSSGPGRAAVAVLRLSGPGARDALAALARGVPAPRRASLRRLRDPDDGRLLDQALVLWFPGPESFTGEDMAELQVHGGRAVVTDLLACLARMPDLRPAEPGAFTRRAFDNGRLDLTAVEGLADLIAADTAAQRRQALRQMDGSLRRVIDDWSARLVALLARLEAVIDFVDEDLPAGLEEAVALDISRLCDEMTRYIEVSPRGERLREGLYVAIVGAPNVGKSSLLNALAQRDVAIVSEQAGTTRDVIEVELDLSGYPVVLADTAGLREAAGAELDAVELEGMRRSLARAEAADLKLAVFDAAAGTARDRRTLALVDEATLLVLNKCDLAAVSWDDAPGLGAVRVSARRGDGLDQLLALLDEAVAERFSGVLDSATFTRARHRQALTDCVAALRRAGGAAELSLQAEDLRLAVRALGRIVGRVDVEDLLDVVFREFCIGK